VIVYVQTIELFYYIAHINKWDWACKNALLKLGRYINTLIVDAKNECAIIALQNVCYCSTYFNAKPTTHLSYTEQDCTELTLDIYLVGRL